jgi:cytochrome c-type biogenesis protein CcmF
MRNRRRYGGYVVHLGVLLIVLGLAGAAFRTESQALVPVGDSMEIGDYTLVYQGLDRGSTSEKEINAAQVDVFRGGRQITTLRPQLNFHFAQSQRQSEVAIRTTPVEDLYVVVTSLDRDGAAGLRAFVNPLTWWIWAGAAVMLLGMAVIISGGAPVTQRSPSRRRPASEPAVVTQ